MQGAIAGAVGIRTVTVASGIVLIVIVGVLLLAWPTLFHALEDEPIESLVPSVP
jgi:predicted cobalt transporter CbtA